MDKIDLKKELKHLYSPSVGKVTVIDVPPMSFLMIDGSGDPNTAPEYKVAVQALYSLSYALKFMVKKRVEIDYAVMPLEGLWWADDMSRFVERRDEWLWTMMIMQPEHISAEMVEQARAEVRKKKGLAGLDHVRFEKFHEGQAAQVLHVGPYAAEGPTIAKLHAFIEERGSTLAGKHHEIYLGDPARTDPDKLKTVLRQPFS